MIHNTYYNLIITAKRFIGQMQIYVSPTVLSL